MLRVTSFPTSRIWRAPRTNTTSPAAAYPTLSGGTAATTLSTAAEAGTDSKVVREPISSSSWKAAPSWGHCEEEPQAGQGAMRRGGLPRALRPDQARGRPTLNARLRAGPKQCAKARVLGALAMVRPHRVVQQCTKTTIDLGSPISWGREILESESRTPLSDTKECLGKYKTVWQSGRAFPGGERSIPGLQSRILGYHCSNYFLESAVKGPCAGLQHEAWEGARTGHSGRMRKRLLPRN